MFLASWSLQQTEQRLKSLTVIQFSNPFQTNVCAGDVHFPGVRSCELSSGMKWDLWDTGSDGGKAVQGVGEGSSSSSLGSWMSSWAQSWEPKPKKGCDGTVMLTAKSRESLGIQKAAKFSVLSQPISFSVVWSVPMYTHPSPTHPWECLSGCCKSSCRALCIWRLPCSSTGLSDRADSLNPNLGRLGRDSEQKLSCVSQLPSYQSQDLISFLKGPIVCSKDCEIVACWVAVNGRAAGPAGMALPEQLTAVQRVADVRLWHPLLPPGLRRGSCFLSLPEPSQDKSLSIWITCISPADALLHNLFPKEMSEYLGVVL